MHPKPGGVDNRGGPLNLLVLIARMFAEHDNGSTSRALLSHVWTTCLIANTCKPMKARKGGNSD